jgi:CubicO group peptidase (beta-lactamase class C family)
MLYFQFSFSQYNFGMADNWLHSNINKLGGRAVLTIIKDGEIIYQKTENNLSRKQKAFGKLIARRQGKDSDELLADYSTSSRQNIASSSKWLSAALVMTFVSEGKLSLNDTVGRYLPEFTSQQKGDITIWQCLAHMTGITGGNIKQSRELISQGKSMNEVIKKIAVLPMEGEPGKVFHYSSIGLQIAAAIIERISGKDFRILFQEKIAGPCEMVNTDFGISDVPLVAGGAISTPEDYIHFLQMIVQNGTYRGRQILSDSAVALMQKNFTTGTRVAYSPAEAGDWGYGLGEWVMDNAGKRSTAVTSPGLFGTFPWVDNHRKYAGFLFVFNLKSKGKNHLYKQLKSIIDDAIDKEKDNNLTHRK